MTIQRILAGPGAGVLALLVMALVGLNCGDDVGTLEERLRECEFLSEGVAGTLPLYSPDACYEECLAAGRCEDLHDALCGSSIDLVRKCDRRCAFKCADGSLLALESVCNGQEDCCDGTGEECTDTSDEDGCEIFACDDGTEVAMTEMCNGYAACPDMSDEADCPTFTCEDDGRAIPAERRCDGWSQCTDESDEDGCAEVILECPEM